MINGNWQKFDDGYYHATFDNGLQAQVMHEVCAVMDIWVWEVGYDEIEAHGEKPNGPEALEAAEAAVREMMEAERE